MLEFGFQLHFLLFHCYHGFRSCIHVCINVLILIILWLCSPLFACFHNYLYNLCMHVFAKCIKYQINIWICVAFSLPTQKCKHVNMYILLYVFVTICFLLYYNMCLWLFFILNRTENQCFMLLWLFFKSLHNYNAMKPLQTRKYNRYMFAARC